MKRDTSETAASNGDEALAAQQHLPSARSSPVSLGRVSAPDMPNNSAMEALLRQEICRLRARILEQILLHSDLIC